MSISSNLYQRIRRHKFVALVLLFTFVIILPSTGYIFYKFYPFNGTYRVTSIALSHDRSVEIRAEFIWELYQDVHYQINSYEFAGFVGYIFDVTPDELDFDVISAENGNLIAIVESSTPDLVLFGHDFANNESWSVGGFRDWGTPNQSCFEPMLVRIQKEHPERNFKQADYTDYRPGMKIHK